MRWTIRHRKIQNMLLVGISSRIYRLLRYLGCLLLCSSELAWLFWSSIESKVRQKHFITMLCWAYWLLLHLESTSQSWLRNTTPSEGPTQKTIKSSNRSSLSTIACKSMQSLLSSSLFPCSYSLSTTIYRTILRNKEKPPFKYSLTTPKTNKFGCFLSSWSTASLTSHVHLLLFSHLQYLSVHRYRTTKGLQPLKHRRWVYFLHRCLGLRLPCCLDRSGPPLQKALPEEEPTDPDRYSRRSVPIRKFHHHVCQGSPILLGLHDHQKRQLLLPRLRRGQDLPLGNLILLHLHIDHPHRPGSLLQNHFWHRREEWNQGYAVDQLGGGEMIWLGWIIIGIWGYYAD